MTQQRIYLDYNATAPLLASARAAMTDALELANPSSVHQEGRAARQAVERARQQVAALVNAAPEHVTFTSGATEALNMILTPDWQMGRAALTYSHAYVSAADHPCVLAGGRFGTDQLTQLPVLPSGIVDLEGLRQALAAHDTTKGLPLVVIHAANSETGVIQPMREIGALVKQAGGLMIFDSVQAMGRINLDITEGYADFFIISAHKIGGPKGVGALVGASDLLMPRALIKGGGQEKSHRAGTENVPAIVGFGAAAEAARHGLQDVAMLRAKREALDEAIRGAGGIIHGDAATRLPNTVFFTLPGVKAETAQIAFDLAGFAVSSGSACSSGKVGPSHVLAAMGVDAKDGALRVSIGVGTTDEDVALFAAALDAFMLRRRISA